MHAISGGYWAFAWGFWNYKKTTRREEYKFLIHCREDYKKRSLQEENLQAETRTRKQQEGHSSGTQVDSHHSCEGK